MNRTKHLHLVLVEKGPDYRFTHADVPALVGVRPASVKHIIHALLEMGAIERLTVPPGTVKRERVGNGGYTGARAAYRITGKPLPVEAEKLPQEHAIDPRPTIRPQAQPRWRSIGAWLMGEPPIGRSALSNFHRLGDSERHRVSAGLA